MREQVTRPFGLSRVYKRYAIAPDLFQERARGWTFVQQDADSNSQSLRFALFPSIESPRGVLQELKLFSK